MASLTNNLEKQFKLVLPTLNKDSQEMLKKQLIISDKDNVDYQFRQLHFLYIMRLRQKRHEDVIEHNRILNNKDCFRILNYDWNMFKWAKDMDSECYKNEFELHLHKNELPIDIKVQFDEKAEETYERLLKEI